MPEAAARSMPPIALHWVKNNALAAIVSGAVSLSIHFVRYATGAADADAGPSATLILYAVAIVLWAFFGAANGVLTGAVLQRVLPLLPTRTWIALQVVISVVMGVGITLVTSSPRGPTGADDVPMLAKLLAISFVGALLGAALGSLEALVLRKVASGTGTWVICSAVAYGLAMLLSAGSESLIRGELPGQLVELVLTLLAAVMAALIMLPALRRLKTPLSTAPQYFT